MIDIFAYPDIHFPKDFLWGASTAGAQVEGDCKSFYDDPETAPKTVLGGMPYAFPEKACNSFEMYRDDIALLKEMNLTLYRLSVEWSRIEPEKGVYDTAALDRYLGMLRELQQSGIKVCLTLHHFSHPVWFHRQGSFDNLDNLRDWETYLEYVVPKLAQYVDYWIVINEMNLPFVYDLPQRLNLLRYHAVGYHIVKKYSDKPVSSAHSYSPKTPLRGKFDKLDMLMAEYVDFTDNEFFFHAIRTGEIIAPFNDGVFLPELKDSCDFWALNIYVRHMIDGRKREPLSSHYAATTFKPLDTPTHMDEICPDIMVEMLLRAADKPCLITENGIPTDCDDIRIIQISAMLQAIHQSMALGADVFGYSHWSLLDNWEWGDWNQTYGLASVDPDTFARTIKKSGRFYGDLAAENGFTAEILRKYCPDGQACRSQP